MAEISIGQAHSISIYITHVLCFESKDFICFSFILRFLSFSYQIFRFSNGKMRFQTVSGTHHFLVYFSMYFSVFLRKNFHFFGILVFAMYERAYRSVRLSIQRHLETTKHHRARTLLFVAWFFCIIQNCHSVYKTIAFLRSSTYNIRNFIPLLYKW